jgi:hypothetical protein
MDVHFHVVIIGCWLLRKQGETACEQWTNEEGET